VALRPLRPRWRLDARGSPVAEAPGGLLPRARCSSMCPAAATGVASEHLHLLRCTIGLLDRQDHLPSIPRSPGPSPLEPSRQDSRSISPRSPGRQDHLRLLAMSISGSGLLHPVEHTSSWQARKGSPPTSTQRLRSGKYAQLCSIAAAPGSSRS
jgi:hypothetical protein